MNRLAQVAAVPSHKPFLQPSASLADMRTPQDYLQSSVAPSHATHGIARSFTNNQAANGREILGSASAILQSPGKAAIGREAHRVTPLSTAVQYESYRIPRASTVRASGLRTSGCSWYCVAGCSH